MIDWLKKLSTAQLWLLSVSVSVVTSECIVMSMAMLLKGEITSDYMLTGLVTSMIVAALIVGLVASLLGHQQNAAAEQYRAAIQASRDGFWITDTSTRILDANESICRLLGYTREELLRLRIADIEVDESPEEIAAHTREMMNTGHVQFEARHRRKDGAIIHVEVSVLYLPRLGERLFAFVRDVTERRRAEAALMESEYLLRESQIVAGLGSYVLDIPSGRWKSSEVFDRLFGIDQTYERTVEGWAALVHPDDRDMMVDYFSNEVLGKGLPFDKAYRIIRHDDGIEQWVQGLGKLEFDDQQRPIQMYGTIQNITERKQAEDRIRTLAYFDALTNLPNRRLLMDRLGQALNASKRTQDFGALMILDLDNFKVLNDTQGHDVGDRLLVDVAQRIVANVRQEDTVSRLGGDEYVMMVERLGRDETSAASQAETIAEKVRKALNDPYTVIHDGQTHYSTPSIGVTLFRGQELSIDVILKQADMALYQAKGAGRNTIRFFNPAMQAAIESRSAMEVSLRRGLERGEFRLFYQPQINQDGQMTGAEALLRWFQPDQPNVSPAQFIPLAEDTGLIIPIGNWVMQTACAQLKAWSNDPRTSRLQISVNVSARQFRQSDFVEHVFDALRSSGANPALLKLELTESVVLNNIDEVITRMSQIKALGVTSSLDDFGTGFSSLAYLKRLPLDQLKIDQSFVRDIISDPNDAAIVQAIIALGRSLGIQVIAEGVETEAQLNFLNESGCKHYQGYYFSRPLPIDAFEQLTLRS
ncbi:MAG: EAL domain-containing protein [Rhodocyclaceae bacterium]|nr:MAG: EAL domain-containing protein [Rhodocyclaceae bacterium]